MNPIWRPYLFPTPEEAADQAKRKNNLYLRTFYEASSLGKAKVESHGGGRPRYTVTFPWPPEPLNPPPESSVKTACELLAKAGWTRMEDRPTGMRDARKIHVWAGNEPVKS